MKHIARFLVIFCCLGSSAFAQVSPAAIGSKVFTAPQGLGYAFRYSQNAQLGTQQANIQTSIVSGSVEYATRSKEKPFHMQYAGGYTWTLSGPDYLSGQFHRMYLSQELNLRRWALLLSDDVAYLPQSPTTGFSGIPGTGEIIGVPNPGSSSSQTILSLNTHMLTNSAHGELKHAFSYATSVNFGGSSDYLYFPNADGIDTRSASGFGELARRLSARTTLSGRYIYTQFSYPSTVAEMHTHTVLVGFRRRATRNLDFSAFGGPQLIGSTVPTTIPPNTTFAVNADLNYLLRFANLNASYSHSTNGGSGYLVGATTDNAQVNFSHQFGPSVLLGINGGYQGTAALNNNGVTNGGFGGTQVTWWLARKLIVYANYTGIGQTSTSQLPGSALTQTINTLSFGFGLSSREQRQRVRP